MLCEHCLQKNATVYFKQTVNGKTTEYRLCADCAAALQKAASPEIGFFTPTSLFGGEDFFSPSQFFARPEREKRAQGVKTCPLCGSRFDELVNTGKMGCAECYSAFGEELEKTILSLHGRASHVGRRPKDKKASVSPAPPAPPETTPSEEMPKGDDLSALRAELQKAITEERYEDAASLRDRIREKENKAEGNNTNEQEESGQ